MTPTAFLAPYPHDTGRRWWDEVTVEIGSARLDMVVITDGEAVTAVHFGASETSKELPASAVRDRKAVSFAAGQLEQYGAGDLKEFDMPLRPSGTEFQMKVWSELVSIPYGTTTSYGRIADAVGRPGGARAVGAAVGSNPIGIVIPCHRVIGGDGSLTGFGGGLDTKVALLRLEGITAF
jgi:methylated-DNA-[protein]-cysteine S-methyltransferase